ncbi:dTDP-4-dehydrorhamnose 3,5-epimerase family protein [Actinomycetospora chiangmaiensis]|uniref:dTDP-4-dehydrorhamnose 3,5-epimerase family protein n=1 Tax=Actinomycetospora chiangmaiensis TaxID=402650 RepID=UPI00035F1138|nr:dTDP-4-dehydrorhamnose 3,5-epimerase [Actinomycetospora chiangmaiensis]
MEVRTSAIDGVLVFVPTPHRDDRGFFTRTFDTAIGTEHGVDLGALAQDSQSRSRAGTIRGMHGRRGAGEAKLVRVAHGAVHDVLVDARPQSPTFGVVASFRLDDVDHHHLYVPAGLLHGFQAISDADVCYRIDRPHAPGEDLGVAHDDPDLAIVWPVEVTAISERDRSAGSWKDLVETL